MSSIPSGCISSAAQSQNMRMSKAKDAIAALFAAITERKPSAVCYAPEEDCGAFLARHAADDETLAAQRNTELHFMPKFLIRLFSEEEETLAVRTRASLQAQSYANWAFAGSRQEAFDFVIFLAEGDMLAPDALFCFAEAYNADPAAELLYADEDVRLPDGTRTDPLCKPEYSELTQLSYNMLGRPIAVSHGLYMRAGGLDVPEKGESLPAVEYDYALRCAAHTRHVRHIPRILCTRGKRPEQIPSAAGIAAVDAYLAATGQPGAAATGAFAGSFRVRVPLGRSGRTAIVIPNRNGADALRRLLESIEEYEAFEQYELIIADGDSRDPRTLRYYDILQKNKAAKIVHGTQNSFAQLCNLGAAEAESETLLFLSRDAQVLTPDWLRALREQLSRPGVGASGGKLISTGRRVLSAGAVAGLCGWADSPYAGEPDDTAELRKNLFINSIRQVTLLSGACMMVLTETFQTMSGFDETFVDAGADLDFCLRLFRRGLASAYTPFAALLLHGVLPRIADASALTRMRCYDTLRPMLSSGDPFFSPHFDYSSVIPVVCADPKPPLLTHQYDV